MENVVEVCIHDGLRSTHGTISPWRMMGIRFALKLPDNVKLVVHDRYGVSATLEETKN